MKRVNCSSGVIGLSPVKGVVDYFSRNAKDAEVFILIAGFKSPRDILFKDDIKMWENNINLILTVDNAEEGYEGNVGMITGVEYTSARILE